MRKQQGFSLLEMMIGMLILIIAVMGFTSMLFIQTQGNKVARGTDEAATIAQGTVESLSNVQFSVLGTDASVPCPNGRSNADVCTEGPLNRLGSTTGQEPYLYYRSIVICQSGSTAAAGASPQQCGDALSGANRPSELACNTLTLSSREKMIRVLVSWTDKYGRCHSVNTDSISFNWSGT